MGRGVMPSRMLHFCITNEILKSIKIDKNMFILGNLSPDAHDGTLSGNFSAHYKKSQIEYPVFDLKAFRNKYMSNGFNEFVLGYYCHIITDEIWSKSIYLEYFQCNEDEKNRRVEMCYEDYFTLNGIILEYFNLDKVLLKVPKQVPVEEVVLEKLIQIVDSFYNDFNCNNQCNKLSILDMQFVLDFIRTATDECLNAIREFSK